MIKRGTGCDVTYENGCPTIREGNGLKMRETVENVPKVVPNQALYQAEGPRQMRSETVFNGLFDAASVA
jgi:hypothetical protein